MLRGQSLYGSDQAQRDDGNVAIGRNLFACLDEDVYDRGPLARSRFRFVADVRLDNRPDLIAGLGFSSTESARTSDSALLFEALLKWGDDAVDRLVGEFAFALWDGARNRWLLGRDIFGFRPLYYYRGKGFFAFSSMPSGLHALQHVPYDFDTAFMAERLALLPHFDSRTHFRNIERVQPGHFVHITASEAQSHSYWRPRLSPVSPERAENYEEGLRSVFEQAVRAQLRGAGDTVAAQLSGGLDSSAVTSTVARLHPEGRVLAFTGTPRAGFDGPSPPGTIANEAELAAATARLHPNIEHVVVENSGESPLRWLDRYVLYWQEPMINVANAVWSQAINHAARSAGSKVLFKGSLGNMSISYPGSELLPLLLSRGRIVKLARHLSELVRNGARPSSLASLTLGPFVPAPAWTALRKIFGKITELSSYSAVNPAYAAELKRLANERADEFAMRPHRDPHETRLSTFRDVDLGNPCKGVLGEWGLSVRDPTADKRVVEYCLRTPVEEFLRGGVRRSLARRAFADRLPTEVTSSRARGYQSADWYEALNSARGEIEDEITAIERCAGAGEALDMKWLRESLDSWPSGDWNREDVIARYRLGLLRGVSAGHFMRKVRGTN